MLAGFPSTTVRVGRVWAALSLLAVPAMAQAPATMYPAQYPAQYGAQYPAQGVPGATWYQQPQQVATRPAVQTAPAYAAPAATRPTAPAAAPYVAPTAARPAAPAAAPQVAWYSGWGGAQANCGCAGQQYVPAEYGPPATCPPYGYGYAAGSSCGAQGVGGYGACAPEPPPSLWGGYVGAVMFDRDDENHRFFSYDSLDEAFQLLDSRDASMDWAAGVEAHITCMNPCTRSGIEGVYWGLYPDDTYGDAYPSDVSGTINGIFNFDQLNYNGGTADNSVNGAQAHRLRREHDIHNFEMNFVQGFPQSCGGCSPWNVQAIAGVRYFKFEEGLVFGSDPTGVDFDGSADELYYTMNADNDLIGLQLGGLVERCLGSNCWVYCGAKAGVFNNHATTYNHIGGSAGTAVINNGPNNGRLWEVVGSKDDLAMIAELQAGVSYGFGQCWRLRSEYRLIGVNGVALPTNQIYQDLRGLQDVQLVATNGSLILHGFFVGVERSY